MSFRPRALFRRFRWWAAFGLCAALGACRGSEDAAPLARSGGVELLVVAIDGLEPEVVARGLAEGRLPNLARFAAEGLLGRLTTLQPTYSPVVWTTVATGQTPAEHGIVFFTDPASGLPFTSEARQVPALWNLVSDGGARVDVAGWWVTWPAEVVAGRMAASYAAQAQAHVVWKSAFVRDAEGQTFPPGLIDSLRPHIVYAGDTQLVQEALWGFLPRPERLSPRTREEVRSLAWTYSADLSYGAIGEHFLTHDPADLVLVYLSLPDVVGHRFWRYHRPEDMGYPVPDSDRQQFGRYLELAYEETDRLLGRLLAVAGDGRAVIVLSDHGMGPDSRYRGDPAGPTSGHHREAQPGVFGALGAPFQRAGDRLSDPRQAPLGDVLGVAPLVLRLLGFERPEHWPAVRHGNPLERWLEPTWAEANPARARAYSDGAWRARHPRRAPRSPGEGADEAFLDALRDLGYLGDEPRRERASARD